MNNWRSFESLKADVFEAIKQNNLNRGLALIHDFVEHIISEPLCVAEVFGSKPLDEWCQRIGKEALNKIDRTRLQIVQETESIPFVVYLVSKVQESGGHTKILAEYIRCNPNSSHMVLSTEIDGRSNSQSFMRELSKDGVTVYFESAPKGNYIEKLAWLQTRLLTIKPSIVYLFNHHQDSVAVAASQPNMGYIRRFFHHGDHHLCLGVYLEDVEHLDAHPMGYHYCRETLQLDNSYVPLCVDDQGERPMQSKFKSGERLVTCTAARSNKVEIPYPFRYVEVIPELLAKTGGTHIHIGRLSIFARFKIYRELRRRSVSTKKFVYLSWVPSVWKALIDYEVDLYVASFPYGGGLTLIEAMGAGVPVALHHHISSPILSCRELAYPNAFLWKSPLELIEHCLSLTTDQLEDQSRSARRQYLKFHQTSVLLNILRSGLSACPSVPEFSGHFVTPTDEWPLWLAQQISLRNLISRSVYRTLKRLRASV